MLLSKKAITSAQQWKQRMEKGRGLNILGMRVAVMEGTWKAVAERKYKTEEGEIIHLNGDEMCSFIKQGKMHSNEATKLPLQFPRGDNKTVIQVCDRDCLEAAYELKFGKLLNPVLLNMANAHTPGGGYKFGDGAQEENIHRRSNYFQYLEDPEGIFKDRPWCYPIPEFGAIYSPSVTVIRGSERDGYPFVRPYAVSMIACAAYCRPRIVINDGTPQLYPEVAEATKQKIRTVLQCGLDNGHDAIVLSAFGCGAFGNPPEHIATLFKEIIDTEFSNTYKCISLFYLLFHTNLSL